MKILLISDEEDKYLWDYYRPGRFDGIDLILSAGDLKPEYLSFLVTMANRPLLYIHGNHDGRYEAFPPEGCDCIDDRLVVVNGLRILGLGGCPLYSGGLKDAVRRTHEAGKKFYVTMNIYPFDDELDGFADAAREALEAALPGARTYPPQLRGEVSARPHLRGHHAHQRLRQVSFGN